MRSKGQQRGRVIRHLGMAYGLIAAAAAAPVDAAVSDLPTSAVAEPDGSEAVASEDILVEGKREKHVVQPTALSVAPTAGIASVYTLDQDAIQGLAVTTANDLLRSIPGVAVANLGNGGIPNGVTIRGWGYVSDGTAVRGVIDGATTNFVSGPNANGSNDLNILIPEIIASVDVIKGPFDTRYSGNYAYAGTAIFTTVDSAPNRAQLSIASFGKERLVATLGNGTQGGPTRFYVAVDAFTERGVRDNNHDDKVNLFAKLTSQISATDVLKISGQLYNDDFGQPGYVRTDLVEQGLIRRYSATDLNAKGYRHSQGATLEWQHRDAVFNFDATAWVQHIRLYRSIQRSSVVDIDDNPFPENIFRDRRTTLGAGVHPWVNFRVAGIDAIFRASVEIRGDFIDTVRAPGFANRLVPQPTFYDAWTGFFNYTHGQVWNPDAYAELSLKPAAWLKLTGGVRNDWFNYDADLTVYTRTATGVAPPYAPGPPVGAPAPLATYQVDSWTHKPTLHGGIAIGPFAGVTLLGNFGEGITSQWLNQVSNKSGVNYPTLFLNPNLAPTKLNTKEVVLKYDNDAIGLHLQGGRYHTLNQGEIGTDLATGNPSNLGKSIRKGWDVDGRLQLFDRDGTSLRIGGNYNKVSARLKGSGFFIAGTPPWTAGANVDAATQIGTDGQLLRLSAQYNVVAGTYLTNGPATIVLETTPAGNVYGSGVLRNGDLNRLALKFQYERPKFQALRAWVSGIFYSGDRFAEMTTTFTGFFNNAFTQRGVVYRTSNSQPKFRGEAGVALSF